MPRVARGLADGMIYHVINRGNARQEVFHKDGDYRAFIGLLKEAKEKYPIQLFGYCLMPNHFHLLLSPECASDLSKFMQWLMTSHVRRYHRHYQTDGHVWQGRYKSFVVENDRQLLTVCRYIEGNPVRAGLVQSADHWQWSSIREREKTSHHTLIDKLAIPIPAPWLDYVNAPLTLGEQERIRLSMNRGAPFGQAEWQIRICQQLGLESTIRPIGRPRKYEDKKGQAAF